MIIHKDSFPTNYNKIIELIDSINPIAYGQTRNYTDGAVTRLSPYLSRGVISTKMVFKNLIKKGHTLDHVLTLLKELAWRDYYQLVWKHKHNIDIDLHSDQVGVTNYSMPAAVLSANTDINALDRKISDLYQTGYMHNHVRMYVASLCCNIAGSHWLFPARWMYYHLLDADWASNALSWQ